MVMAAVGHRETIARKAPAPSRQRASLLVLFMVAAGYALTVLAFYPGYTTADARYVYADAMAWHFGDWQSPAMAVLWRLIDPIAPGSSSMFLLTATLYWLAFGTLALIAARLALARPCNPARRVHAAGFLFRRDGLARRAVRGHLARGGGARLCGD
jgi:hypothetical protein